MKSTKITKSAQPARRSYDDACGAAHALDLLGDRWALLVVRELMLGPKRFGDLKVDLPGISANVLTQRLDELEGTGIVQRTVLPPPASVAAYELTPWGYESEPIFMALGRWGARSPLHDPSLPVSAVSIMLSFRTMFQHERAKGLTLTAAIVAGSEQFVVTIRHGKLTVSRGEAKAADFTFSAPEARIVAAAVYGGQSLAALEKAGVLAIAGDRALAKRFVTLFPLPEKVG
ncbi:MAG: winged helix-turn-helix transcriptional regulator [Hyphomicrobiaceae bacterium]